MQEKHIQWQESFPGVLPYVLFIDPSYLDTMDSIASHIIEGLCAREAYVPISYVENCPRTFIHKWGDKASNTLMNVHPPPVVGTHTQCLFFKDRKPTLFGEG